MYIINLFAHVSIFSLVLHFCIATNRVSLKVASTAAAATAERKKRHTTEPERAIELTNGDGDDLASIFTSTEI